MRSEDNEIDNQAAAWVAKEDRGPLPADQAEARDRWLGEDRRHLGAYARARAVFVHSQRAQALAGRPLRMPAPARLSVARSRVLGWLGALAAAIGVLAIGVVQLDRPQDTYTTSKGQVLRVPLADGSAMTLDSDSQVRVHYTPQARAIELVRGEALFDVAKNPGRPFVVSAEQTQVTAVGTSFAVSLSERRTNGVEVLVREGIVDVADVQGRIAPTRLQANSRALASRAHGIRIEAVADDDLHQQLAWREGMLSFNGDTLSTAAAQFSRYSDLRIVIDDPQVGSQRIVGLYSASDPVGFANSVALSLGLVVEPRGSSVLLRAPHVAAPRATHSLQ